MTPQMNGELSAVYQLCYPRTKFGDFGGDPPWRVTVSQMRKCGRGSPRSRLWNAWLSCLLILEERYSQCCASACADEPFRGRPLCTDSHYWYTSHSHQPTRSTADTRKGTHTYTLSQSIKDTRRIENVSVAVSNNPQCGVLLSGPFMATFHHKVTGECERWRHI